ncbi:MAG: FHA domain-containing protein, partial [Cyanobacteria bacterium P01_H01_bin.15]
SSVISISRHRRNHIVITNKTLSRHHAYLWKMGCGDSLQFQLIEGEIGGGPSNNGTFLNNQRVDTQSLLTDGDILTFGVHIKARYLCHYYFDVNYI